ncbi:Hint domain-containing protein [Roseococcus sp. YIM B11640]|uniref:Hint domain-containing protein n=1 Tax=Roseococcus sp. YIM B11640 TaxID=3133973 RepID=UPI003C7AD39A
MATYTYDYLFNTAGGNINAEDQIAGFTVTGPYTFDIPDGDTLSPGTSVNVNFIDQNGDPATTSVTYLGQSTTTGEPYFTFNGQEGFVSNTEYPIGAGTAPPYAAQDFDESLYCFLAGTLIATPTGSVKVEDLAIGDMVLTADGGVVPVKWMGRQTIVSLFGIDETRHPVSIAAGALGPNLPARELRVTADHALVIDGLLVNASALVNGSTIRRLTPSELGERFTVYHIELDAHDVVLAEGMPAETFVDFVSRGRFDNYAEYKALFGTPAENMEALESPRVKSARQLPAAIRERVAARAAELLAQDRVAA